MPLVFALASLKLTLAGMLLLAIATVAVYQLEHAASAWLALPFALLTLNLVAAVLTNGVFRAQTALLVFHLALVALVGLATVGRLTYLNGAAEVTEGVAFGGLMMRDAGPLHGDAIERLSFVNEGFEITYKPGPTRDRTVNRVRWTDERGRDQVAEIGDNRPLVLAGYRFYPTSNKGFAPVLLWQPSNGPAVLGALHLPSYPVNDAQQARDWRPVGSAGDIWVMLDIEEKLIPEDQPSRFRLPETAKLIVRYDNERYEIARGGRVALRDGVLEFRDLRTWMGYTVFYDWTVPWMLAACVLAVVSLSWHFGVKFARRPWSA